MSAPNEARAAFSAWRARVAENAFTADPHLQSLLRVYGREAVAPELEAFGARVATELDHLARETNRDEHLPVLRRYDGQGVRTEGVSFHPGYHELGRAVYGTGVMSRYARPGQELETLALMYLVSQNGEAGHACPLACTAGMIKILQEDGGHPEWLTRLLDPDYDTHFHASQFLTEVQGGSDVGANALVARQGADGAWRLTGEKWFCSVIDAHLFLVTARPEGGEGGTRGLMAFAVPREWEGAPNGFALRRLKVKLGTRSMASAEVDFQGAIGFPVGDFRRVVEIVLNTSRLYNAAASSGMLQRAWREADGYARTRTAFGRPILAFPAVARTVARMKVEAYAARSTTFFLVDLADRLATGRASERDALAWRMLVNLNKFWTSLSCTSAVRDAIEILGGNGAIEEFSVVPRLLRDSIVCEAWEGSHNVLCNQVLKDSVRYRVHEALFDLLEELAGPEPRLAEARARWSRVVEAPPERAAVHMRAAAEALRAPIHAATLRAEARHPGADPLLPVVIEDLLTTTAPGYDPLLDDGLVGRVAALTA